MSTYWCDFDLPAKEDKLNKLHLETQSPDFWSNPESAQRVMKESAFLEGEINDWKSLTQHIAETIELSHLDDESLRADLEKEVEQIEAVIAHKELNAMLSGEYDPGNALLAIHAGAGGTDSQDWAEKLERMYLRWAENPTIKWQLTLGSAPWSPPVFGRPQLVRGWTKYHRHCLVPLFSATKI